MQRNQEEKYTQKYKMKGASSRNLNKPDDPSAPKNRASKDKSRLLLNEDGELTEVHPLSRATSSWSTGLYSSVLSIAVRRSPEDREYAIWQARAVTSASRSDVKEANS